MIAISEGGFAEQSFFYLLFAVCAYHPFVLLAYDEYWKIQK
jgi:hypothetical protein